jgi:putative restriction endonuclease
MVAIIYEPRGARSDGRMAYVGWALLQSPPVDSGRRNARRQVLYRVTYADRYREFDKIVPREATGEPIETWLRAVERGRERNVATFGRAVRPLIELDLQLVMGLGFPNGVERFNIESPSAHEFAEAVTIEERSRRLIAAADREARFRDDVLAAYAHRCSLSGLSVGTSPSRAYGLLDAAHIRPVGSHGADILANGMALTPTLHRLFDKGLFTLVYRGRNVEVRTSPRLSREMVQGRDGFEFRLVNGLDASLPVSERARPSREALEYHHSQIFIGR